MNTVIIDSKNMFNRHGGISSLGDMIYLDYENFSFAFSGFVEFGRHLGEIPIFLSLIKEEKKAILFSYCQNDHIQRKLFKKIHKKLTEMGYDINPIRMEAESYNVGKN